MLASLGADTNNVQTFIDEKLAAAPANGSEWYVIALSQSGTYDFSRYESALVAYLNSATISSASSRLKFALCLVAVGSENEYIRNAIDSSVGKQGIMSLIFGLHLINNGYTAADYTAQDLALEIVGAQLADGGWSVVGQAGDPDVTAMALQAVAPYCESNASVKSASERAVDFLSSKQLPSGDFASFGTPNPESTAQVIIALASLGIDAENDARFKKNGTPFDGINKYRLPSGDFAHTEGGASNANATMQVFCASAAYIRFCRGLSPFYSNLGSNNTNGNEATGEQTTGEQTTADKTGDNGSAALTDGAGDDREQTAQRDGNGNASYKPYAVSAIVLVACGVALGLFVAKKRKISNFVAVILVAAAASAAVLLTDVRTPEDYYGSTEQKTDVIGTVSLSIRCDTVVGLGDAVPQNGIILDTVYVDISEGDTVLSVLTEAARRCSVRLDVSGDGALAYVNGIAFLYEFDFGPLSGWTYRVNGEMPSVGAGAYTLADGDVIEWLYTKELGSDISRCRAERVRSPYRLCVSLKAGKSAELFLSERA